MVYIHQQKCPHSLLIRGSGVVGWYKLQKSKLLCTISLFSCPTINESDLILLSSGMHAKSNMHACQIKLACILNQMDTHAKGNGYESKIPNDVSNIYPHFVHSISHMTGCSIKQY